MKYLMTLVLTSLLFVSCQNKKEQTSEEPEVTYSKFGSEITADKAIDKAEMAEIYKNLKEGDTVTVKFKSEINEVCQKKGCWMSMDLDEDNEAFVRFTDYGFFVPKNAADQNGIVEGRAFVSITSVDELKHYAKDAGKSQKEIDEITEPETTYSFLADGVLVQDKTPTPSKK